MKKGEIWIAEMPSVDGREQTGIRPTIVLTDTIASLAVIIPITTNMRALRFPHTLELNPSKQNGLKTFSVALIFQLRAVDKQRLKHKIGTLESQNLKAVDTMLKKMLAL